MPPSRIWALTMSQTKHQEQGTEAAAPRVRKDWELFWRIIAGLILLVIAWVAWVAYQIMPRSVVTPLAYATQVKPISMQNSESGVAAPPVPAASVVPSAPPSPTETAADAPVPAAAVETKALSVSGEGLRLATEISIPPAGKQEAATTQEGKPGSAPVVPAGAGAAGKTRP